jgi:hypothetical protein
VSPLANAAVAAPATATLAYNAARKPKRRAMLQITVRDDSVLPRPSYAP